MTTPALITIPMSPWVGAAGVLLLAILLLLVWSYRRVPRTGGAATLALGLKLLGVLALALCLVEPLWSGRRATSGANVFAVVADNSSGMNIHDTDAVQSRGEILRDILQAGETGWRAAISDNFQLRQYLFDSRLRRTENFADLTFDGKATALGATLQTLAQRYQGRPLAGILLLTDGCATDADEPSHDLSGLPPVYPVVVGTGRPPQDLSVANVSVSQTSFEDAPVTVQADVEAAGFAGRTVAVDLRDNAGNRIERQQWRVAGDDEKQVFRFRLHPDRTGVLFYRLQAAEEPSPTGPPAVAEATPANNERTVVVDRGKGPYRILYVAGRPNWDLKFLKRAIEEDEQVQLVVLLRVARREPKYDWRGHSGETTNPLYRGFDPEDKEKAEEYDQPVLVRLNTRDEVELREGFPKTPEGLFEYSAVIFDDVEAEFFTHEQMDLVRRFVSERGGSFLMLGGKDSFQRGGFDRTPIGAILPVYLDALPAAEAPAAARLDLTREGWLQPWARLRDNEQEETKRLAEMPEFQVLNRIRTVKPGASVIATTGAGDQTLPVLTVQRLGHGRTAALALGDVWRWGMRKPEMHVDMDKFWRQTLRWLVADVPARISVQATPKPDQANQPVVLQVRVRDQAFEPMDNVTVSVDVSEPAGHGAQAEGLVRSTPVRTSEGVSNVKSGWSGSDPASHPSEETPPGVPAHGLDQATGAEGDPRSVQLTAMPVPAEQGLFEAVYLPRTSGGYVAQATVAGADGTKLGEAQTGWTVDLEAREYQSLKANRPLLERIARQTGGRLLAAGELDRFARGLPHRAVPISETWVRPLWDVPGIQPVLFLFALSCFIAEWALRRWKGMP
jgi:uncharacterized membrane protein